MDPITFTVNDTNVYHYIHEREQAHSEKNQQHANKLLRSTNNNKNKAMFPNVVKYIFEDDIEDNNNNNENIIDLNSNANSIQKSNDTRYKNVFIVEMNDNNNGIENIELISDQYELLNYHSKKENYENKDNNVESINGSADSSNKEWKINNWDIEINVLSRFKNLSPLVDDLSLEELINIFNIQNKQIKSLFESL